MYFSCGKKGLIGALALALAVLTMTPNPAAAGPEPGAKRPAGKYRLFATNLGAISVNQVVYGFATTGEIGVDSTGSSTVGGGFWPKGTGNQYMFNSGLEVAGIIQGTKPNNPWAGDTTGGFFFDGSGQRQHGTPVTEFQNSNNPVDLANWLQAARVPQGDVSEDVFDELLRGRISASQGDVWFMSRETDPSLSSGRSHPLGIVSETRVLGWNFPAGNEDIIYVVTTVYNVSTTDPAAYAQYRPGLREILIEQANLFATQNNAAFNINLPSEGYTIDPMFVSLSSDPDVTSSAGANFSSGNLPFSMGYAYHADFIRAAGWTFSPTIFGAPFFPGAGFIGMKFLKGPLGNASIQLFSNRTNGGAFPDPNTTVRLYKYLSGTVLPVDGVSCNTGDPLVSNVCFVGQTIADVRMQIPAAGFALPAGGSASTVMAYIHAAPVQIPGYTQGTRVPPGDITVTRDPVRLAVGANRIDSLTGFNGYTDVNGDNIVQQDETRAIRGSLLGKALVAQSIFDSKFLLPFAPDAPDFFLIPNNEQVTVVWRPSASESTGDPFFAVASQVTVVPEGGGAPVANPLYDPNYRNFDVEGYRVYRGRADTPNSLKLLAQFDYAGTTFKDFRGQVISEAVGNRCAPELNVTGTCAGFFSPVVDGQAATLFRSYDIVSPFIQVRFGNRDLLASGVVVNLETDTLVTGRATGRPELDNSGVPFVFIDNEVRNGLRYFYAVTAFDVNSITSTGPGNTSLESARITKSVTPNTVASNFVNEASVQPPGVFGRNGLLTDNVDPTLSATTGQWSKKWTPTNAVSTALVAFVKEVLAGGGEVGVTLDSITVGAQVEATSQALTHHYTSISAAGASTVSVPFIMSATTGVRTGAGSFPALVADNDLAARFNAPSGGSYGIAASVSDRVPSGYYAGVSSRGCVNGAAGFSGGAGGDCYFGGPRWFAGNNETMVHPNGGTAPTFTLSVPVTDFNNAGELPGVVTVHRRVAYSDAPASWRRVELNLSPFIGAADYRLYWGAGGTVDSVIDLTHDVVVPFGTRALASWGFFNAGSVPAGQSFDQRAELTSSDLGCIEPLKSNSVVQGIIACSGTAVPLVNTAVPGPIVLNNAFGTLTGDRTAPIAANNGFGLYIKGRAFIFELAGGALPAAGTEWTMRDYIGAVRGGVGSGQDFGPYVFTTQGMPRQLTAVGASVKVQFSLTNEVQASTKERLKKIHTVPDPYYVTSQFEATTNNKIINFVNLPEKATIRIYTVSGILVRVLKHDSGSFGGELTWDVRNRNNTFVASGVYFYHVTAENGETTVGRMTIVNFAN